MQRSSRSSKLVTECPPPRNKQTERGYRHTEKGARAKPLGGEHIKVRNDDISTRNGRYLEPLSDLLVKHAKDAEEQRQVPGDMQERGQEAEDHSDDGSNGTDEGTSTAPEETTRGG